MSDETKVVVGVDSVYYALVTQDDVNGYVAGAPAVLVPAMELKSTPKSASETLYADNGANDRVSAEGETDLELISPNFPELVLAALTGKIVDAATGRVFDHSDPSGAPYFALGYRFKKSNGHYRYRWYLKCRAEEPGEEAVSQSDKPNLKPKTLKVSAMKTIYKFDLKGDGSLMDGVKRVHGDQDTASFSATTWFAAVQVPLAGSPGAFTVSSVPADAATGVALAADVVITFSNELQDGAEDHIILTTAAGVPVACARTINTARKIVTLNPNSNLTGTTDYLVIIPGVVDIYGQTLANTVINFTTV